MAEKKKNPFEPEDDEADAIKFNPVITHLVAREKKNQKKGSKKPGEETLGLSSDPKLQNPTEQRIFKRLVPTLEEECYNSGNANRGICVIIELDEFKASLGLNVRKGSDVDVDAIIHSFNRLGFDTFLQKNMPLGDMMSMLERMSDMDHSQNDCFALVFLSHGNEGILYAYDAPFPVQKIWEPFTPQRCPSLAGKPKLFFIQACQGNNMDEGVRMKSVTSTDSFSSYKMPNHSDFFIAHSTISGFYSWRNTFGGSWFIQSVAKILAQEDGSNDLMTIMTKVNRMVAQEYESSSSRVEYKDKKQTPFFYSTLIAKLYFSPK